MPMKMTGVVVVGEGKDVSSVLSTNDVDSRRNEMLDLRQQLRGGESWIDVELADEEFMFFYDVSST